jgi:hypothetical protein
MNIVDATIIESQDATRSAFNMYAAIDWFNAHPEYCFRMAQFLSTNNVMFLDPSLSRSVFDVISLRTLEECITRTLRTSTHPLHIATFQSYRRNVNTHTKSCFDMYCRHHIVRLKMKTLDSSSSNGPVLQELDTSVAQLNLIRWLMTYGNVCVKLAFEISKRKKCNTTKPSLKKKHL